MTRRQLKLRSVARWRAQDESTHSVRLRWGYRKKSLRLRAAMSPFVVIDITSVPPVFLPVSLYKNRNWPTTCLTDKREQESVPADWRYNGLKGMNKEIPPLRECLLSYQHWVLLEESRWKSELRKWGQVTDVKLPSHAPNGLLSLQKKNKNEEPEWLPG